MNYSHLLQRSYYINYNWTSMVSVYRIFFIILFLIVSINYNAFAQEHKVEEPKSMLVVSFGYSYVPAGAELVATEAEGVFVPSIGLDYGRKVGKRWEIGVMLDFELDHYLIAEKELERENAFIVVVGAAFSPVGHLIIFTGAGIEFEQNENLFIYRLGVDYNFHLNHHWALVPAFYFDRKEDYYTYAISFGVKYEF